MLTQDKTVLLKESDFNVITQELKKSILLAFTHEETAKCFENCVDFYLLRLKQVLFSEVEK